MRWHDGGGVSTPLDASRKWLVLKRRLYWPFAPWDVMGIAVQSRGFERFAGGFWTRRGAKQWVEQEDK